MPGKGVPLRPGALKAARTRKGMTMEELGLGIVDRTAIGHYEQGDSRPTAYVLRRLARRLGVPIVDLVDGTDSKLPPGSGAPSPSAWRPTSADPVDRD